MATDRQQGVNDPEALHLLADNMKPATGPGFVNPGTPTAPLVSADQLINPETSKAGSKSLTDGLIK